MAKARVLVFRQVILALPTAILGDLDSLTSLHLSVAEMLFIFAAQVDVDIVLQSNCWLSIKCPFAFTEDRWLHDVHLVVFTGHEARLVLLGIVSD